MPGLSIVFIIPLVLAGLTAFLGRWPRAAAAVGAGGAVLLAIAISIVAPGGDDAPLQWEPLGRTLTLDAATGQLLVLIVAGTAALLVLAALWPQGRDFTAAILATLAPLALALMIRPFVYGAAALVVAAAILVALIQAGRAGSTRAATRYLLVMALALPFFLVAGWMLDSEQLILLRTLWRLLLLGTVLLLAGVPFHFWVRPLVAEGSPLGTVFVLGPAQLVAVTFVAGVLDTNPALRQTGLDSWLRIAGVATMGFAGIVALVAVKPHHAVAYAALLDMGAVLASLGAGPAGLPAMLFMVLARTLGLALAMLGLARLEHRLEVAPDEIAGSGRWSSILVGYGTLSLLGLPLTPGFTGRWAAISLLGEQSPWLAGVALFAVAAGTIGLWRSLPHPALPELARPQAGWRFAPVEWAAVVLLLVAILLALFPAWPRTLSATIAALLA
jgi:formate hydrogenlyase subunit 3/multisubunit Na+/H+ antiporter MnhD subunit